MQSDEVAEIISMGPTATKGGDPTISIVSNSDHCPLRDSCTNPGSSQNKIRSIQGHPAESSEVMVPHVARPGEGWLQGRVKRGLLNQGARISTTNINVSGTDELDELSNDHMGGHMAKRMPNGEQNEELLMDKTGCQNKDIPPTLTPLQDTAPDSTGHQEGDQSLHDFHDVAPYIGTHYDVSGGEPRRESFGRDQPILICQVQTKDP